MKNFVDFLSFFFCFLFTFLILDIFFEISFFAYKLYGKDDADTHTHTLSLYLSLARALLGSLIDIFTYHLVSRCGCMMIC